MSQTSPSIRAVAAILAGSFLLAGLAAATPAMAVETATSSITVQPRGEVFKEVSRPVDAHLEVKVEPATGSTTFRELINTKLILPKDLSFSIEGTPVCTADIGQINPNMANRPTAAVVAQCPDSAVGEGTAVINVAGLVSLPFSDPVLTIFNGGRDHNGDPVLLTHGYSETVQPGGLRRVDDGIVATWGA